MLSGRTGSAASVRELAGCFVLAAGVQLGRAARTGGQPGRLVWLGSGFAAALAALLTAPLTSHAAAHAGAGWAVPADLAHLVAVSLWLGCLAQLPALVRPRSAAPAADRIAWLAGVCGRFSALASVSVAGLILTGLFNASVEVALLSNLTSTAYGRTLLIKLAAVALLLLTGLLNAGLLAPRRRRAALEGDTGSAWQLLRWLRRTIAVELSLSMLVVGITAALMYFVPARDAVAGGRAKLQPGASASSVYRNTAPAGDLQTALTITPNRAGDNQFRLLISGPDAEQATRV